MPRKSRVLAFDPGYERLGVAVIEKQSGKDVLVFSDCVRTKSTQEFSLRLKTLGDTAANLIKKWKPDVVALEQIFFEKNAKTAMGIAEVRGVLTYVSTLHEIPVIHYAPAAIKIAITGYGNSDKAAVALMVGKLLALPARKRLDDELDAIAVGITCLASLR